MQKSNARQEDAVSQTARLSGVLLVLTAVAVLLSRPLTVVHGQTNDEEQIRALENRFAGAFKAKDVNGIMANYDHSPNLVFFDVVPRREYRGWTAYRNDWQSFFASIGPIATFEVKDLSINVDGDLAYSYSFQHYLATTKAGGSKEVTVRVTDVYRKSGGEWLIVQEHVSVPVDPQTLKPDLAQRPARP